MAIDTLVQDINDRVNLLKGWQSAGYPATFNGVVVLGPAEHAAAVKEWCNAQLAWLQALGTAAGNRPN